MRSLVIRADADLKIGTGHVMRCLALAQAWIDRGGKVRLVGSVGSDELAARIAKEGVSLEKTAGEPGSRSDAKWTAKLADEAGADWVVIDGYQFDHVFQKTLLDQGRRLLALDDYGHLEAYSADLIINQNLGAGSSLYLERPSDSKLLLGTSFTLLRREFWPWVEWEREIPDTAVRLLVTLGGSDPDNVTETVLRSLARVDNEELDVVCLVGANNQHLERLQAVSSELPLSIKLIVNAYEIPDIMAEADLAISAGGSTCWEMAFMGLPAIVLLTADNQRDAMAALDHQGAIRNLGWHETAGFYEMTGQIKYLIQDAKVRRAMSVAGRRLVDGLGVQRVIQAMSEYDERGDG